MIIGNFSPFSRLSTTCLSGPFYLSIGPFLPVYRALSTCLSSPFYLLIAPLLPVCRALSTCLSSPFCLSIGSILPIYRPPFTRQSQPFLPFIYHRVSSYLPRRDAELCIYACHSCIIYSFLPPWSVVFGAKNGPKNRSKCKILPKYF